MGTSLTGTNPGRSTSATPTLIGRDDNQGCFLGRGVVDHVGAMGTPKEFGQPGGDPPRLQPTGVIGTNAILKALNAGENLAHHHHSGIGQSTSGGVSVRRRSGWGDSR